jgi:hypothetical protein
MRWVVLCFTWVLAAGIAEAQVTVPTIAPVPGGINQFARTSNFPPTFQPVPGGINQQVAPSGTTGGTTTSTDGTETGTTLFPLGDYGGSYSIYASSSVPEGFAKGLGEAFRGYAAVGLARSQAAVNYSVARQIQIQNAQQWYALRSAQIAANRAYWDQFRRPALTPDQWAEMSRGRLPKRLSPADFDQATGRISWPSVLLENQFAPLRSEIEDLLARRAKAGGLSAGGYIDLDQAIDQLHYELAQRIREYPTDLYISANRFLDSLGYESKLATPQTAAQIGKVLAPAGQDATAARPPAVITR